MEKSKTAALINKRTIMELQTLLHADYLDIIFDNRNKKYGGYELRRGYARRVGISGALLFLGVGILSGFTLVGHEEDAAPKVTHIERVVDLKDIQPVDPPPLPPIPPTPPPPPPKQFKTEILTPPRIVIDEQVKPDEHMTKIEDLRNAQIGHTRSTGDSTDIAVVTVEKKPGGGGTGVLKEDKPPILTVVEQPPTFDGDMGSYLARYLHYPDEARESNIHGRVIIKFVVNEDGAVSNASIARGIGGGCDEEALRIVRSMPKWKPGKQNGIPVKVYFMLPISFVLN